MEDIVQDLEKKWAEVQEHTLKQPSPGMSYFHLFIYIFYNGGKC